MKLDDETAKRVVYATVSDCMKLLRRNEYEMNFPPHALDRARSSLRFYSRTNGRSRGSVDNISICLTGWQRGNNIFQEYDSYAADPVIGSRSVNDEIDYFMLVAAHETAHHVQFAYGPRISRFRLNYRKPHGDCFKAIYRYLRRDLINPIIEGRVHLQAAGK